MKNNKLISLIENGTHYSPTQISGLVLWLDAGKITGIANKGTISQWDDLSGNGNHCTQTTEANKPIYSAIGINGKPEVALSYKDLAADTLRWMTIPNGVSLNRNNGTIIIIGRPISKALSAGYTVPVCVGDFKFGWGGLYPTGVISSLREANTILQYFQPTFISLSSSPDSIKIFYNNLSQTFTATSALSYTGGRIGTDTGGLFKAYGVLNEVLVYNRALSDIEMGLLWDYARKKYELYTLPTKQVIFDGDSLTTGYACLNHSNFPGQTWGLLGSDWKMYCVPVAGQTLNAMISDGVAEIDSKYNAGLAKNVVVCWAGLLDIDGGDTPAQALTDLNSYCTARRAAGWQVVVLTCLPSLYISDAERVALNTGIRDNWETFADAIADIAADSRIGDAGDNDNPVYYNNSDGNKTHLTQEGFAIVAQITADAINGLT